MKLQQLVEALDAQILSGDIVGAFDKFAAEDCVTKSNAQDITQSKAQKLEILNWFFHNIAGANRIERTALKVGDNVTESQFVFDFVNKQGQPLVYNEVIRRTWKDGKMVEEQYLLGQTLEVSTKTAAKTPSKKAATKSAKPATAATSKNVATKSAKPAAATTPKATKKAEPKADKKPATKKAGSK